MVNDRRSQVTSIARSAESLQELIDDVSRANLRAWASAGDRVNLISGDLSILTRLVASGSMTGLELGRTAGLPSSSVTDTADRLERAGMIKRSRAKEDRRVVVLSPTAKGRRAVARALEPLQASLGRVGKRHRRAELEAAVGLLLDVEDALITAASSV
jgi:DNA-binding MarR family transcriptional regulator